MIKPDTLASFRKAIGGFHTVEQKQYTLIVVTSSSHTDSDPSSRRILLGHKHRGFGSGLFNSFGGKIEPGESVDSSARRELEEETGISLPLEILRDARLGTLFFTFADSATEMVVHLFRVEINTIGEGKDNCPYVDPCTIRGCDEITPQWFDQADIPLHQMFADDSVWLTRLLTYPVGARARALLDGWFHFQEGGVPVNTILHHHLHLRRYARAESEIRDTLVQSLTLEKRLFHELHQRGINSPTLKEFNEAFAFASALRIKSEVDCVIDVAGGHGALGALLLITTAATEAVVVDPACVGRAGVERAWGTHLRGKMFRYRHECLRTGLPNELEDFIRRKQTDASRILVVACHACQHLSEEIVDIACRFGVQVAVMPCCQRDTSPGCAWKAASKNLGIPVNYVMDLLLAGKAMSWSVGLEAQVTYDVRMRLINHKLTPQNRLILCRPKPRNWNKQSVDRAHAKLGEVYHRAHLTNPTKATPETGDDIMGLPSPFWRADWLRPIVALACGFALGLLASKTAAGKRSSTLKF